MKKIEVRKSGIAGRGLFAGEDIKKGEFVIALVGKEIKKPCPNASECTEGKTWIGIGDHHWINPTCVLKYINHSCDPNLGFKTPRRAYAMHDIKKGEEITLDYSTVEHVIYWKLKCFCGKPHCRGWITSVQFLPKKTFERYLPYISKFFQKMYLDFQKTSKY